MAEFDEETARRLQVLFDQFQNEEDNTNAVNSILLTLLERQFNTTGPHMRKPNIDRERLAGHVRLMKDYFITNPVYPAHLFRRRFKMYKHVVWKLVNAMVANNIYFEQHPDALGVFGLLPVQKVTTALRMLAYDSSADHLDEYLRLGESTSLRCLTEFCSTMVATFGPEYLRTPTAADTARILKHSAKRGFPGMMGSVDCMHWNWQKCPVGWAGQFQDRHANKSIILEAVATYDLWIWHSFFGSPGSLNDINVLDRSPLFHDLMRGVSPKVTFMVNNSQFDQTYYLADGIYPHWPIFVQTFSNPLGEKRKWFAKMQEAARKDIERAFGVLHQRWAILRNPSRVWHHATLRDIMLTCIILYNMIVEDEQGSVMECRDWPEVQVEDRSSHIAAGDWAERFAQEQAAEDAMHNEGAYHILQEELIEHVWSMRQE